MQSAKEAVANATASAKAGMEKTKATVQEKGERMATRDPMMKDIAEEKKDEKIRQADLQKQEARGQNAATRQTTAATGTPAGMGQQGYTTGTTGTGEGEVPREQPGAGRVLPQDPNIAAGGAKTGYGAGSTC